MDGAQAPQSVRKTGLDSRILDARCRFKRAAPFGNSATTKWEDYRKFKVPMCCWKTTGGYPTGRSVTRMSLVCESRS